VLAASVPTGEVWQVLPDGATSLFASGIGGPNFIVQSPSDGRIFASAANADEIVEITGGEVRVVATGLDFPNGLALRESGPRRYLYVALTLVGQVVRLPLRGDGVFGEPELFAEGLTLVDGIAFDRAGNLLAVGFDTLWAVDRDGNVEVLSEDPLLDWPSNLAFGQGPGFSSRDLYLANFGPNFGDGMDVVRLRYSISGAPLAAVARPRPCGRGLARTRSRGSALRCP
jgi:sugar lactone lactonase YvrE